MQTITSASEKELKSVKFLLKSVKTNMGFVPNSLKTMAREPAILANFSLLTGILIGNPDKVNPLMAFWLNVKNMFWSLRFLKRNDRLPLYLRNLISHVTSNAAGCRYCQAHTIHEAAQHGASKEKIEDVWDFENSSHFDEKEKVALRFAFAAGCIPNAVTDEHFTALKLHFSEPQIIELGAIVSLFGFLNRWNDSFATTLENEPLQAGKTYLNKSGWEIGKHS